MKSSELRTHTGRKAAPRIVFMFSGQGAQYYQMGRQLYNDDPVFRSSLAVCERLAGPINGRSLTEIMFSRPLANSAEFDSLRETHPLLVSLGWSLAQTLLARGIHPDAVLGYSLGETIAAVMAGALGLEEALGAVIAQAEMFERHARPAAMVAVLAGADAVMADPRIAALAHLACINAPGHCVLSLAEENLDAVTHAIAAHDWTLAKLPIRHGFHSELIEENHQNFLNITTPLTIKPPQLPFYSCATGTEIDHIDAGHFWSVARGQVQFFETARPLLEAGSILVDVGPSGTLAGMLQLFAGKRPEIVPLINQFGRDTQMLSAATEACQ